MDYTILVIDDDKAMHYMVKNLLGKEYNLIHAESAQGGIDKLSDHAVNLILTDVHMEGMTGIEFLQSLSKDAARKSIPVLVMTNLPTVEKQERALGFGAADFIDKDLFLSDPEEVKSKVQIKLVTNIDTEELTQKLTISKKEMIKKLMFEVSAGDFLNTSQKLCKEVCNQLTLDHLSFWTVQNNNIRMILAYETKPPAHYGPNDLKQEPAFQKLMKTKKPYLTNNIFTEEGGGILQELSEEEDLPSEIGIPLFAITDKELIKNKMKIPPNTPLFAYIALKRKRVFSTKEYRMISTLMVQMGTILWRLYKNM